MNEAVHLSMYTSLLGCSEDESLIFTLLYPRACGSTWLKNREAKSQTKRKSIRKYVFCWTKTNTQCAHWVCKEDTDQICILEKEAQESLSWRLTVIFTLIFSHLWQLSAGLQPFPILIIFLSVNTDVDSFAYFKYVNTTQSWIENLIQRVHPKTYTTFEKILEG